MKRLVTIVFSFILILNLVSCVAIESDKLQVFASFYVVYDFTSRIAGDYADVYFVTPIDAESHDWEPTAKDMARIENADILFYSSPEMEHWVAKVDASIKSTSVVMLSDGLEDKNLDPHVWLNPTSALEQMKRITEALSETDPANEAGYRKNYETAEAKITELNSSFTAADLGGKTIITDHAAYSHLCEAYGMTQISLDSLNSGSDVSASRIAEIIKYIKENGFRYIYCEEYSNQDIVDIIAKESGAEKLYLNPCEWISEEQLKNNEDYFSIMYKNLESLKKGAQ